MQFTASDFNENRHPTDLLIQGHDVDDAAPFSPASFNLSNRSLTQESVPWIPPVWTVVNQSNARQQSPDLRHIIQEIVDRPGWQENNALGLLISGTGGRPAYSYEGSSGQAAELHITFVSPPELVRGPYLQTGTDTSILVRFRTNQAYKTTLVYGTHPSALSQSLTENSAQTDHEFMVGGLMPQTRYYYALLQGLDTLLAPDNELFWETAPPKGDTEPIQAWILGDAGTANTNARAVRDAYYAYVDTQHTDMIIMLGDNAYNDGTDQEYQNAVFENMYEDLLRRTVLWSAPGNHEFYNGITSSSGETGPYYEIFSFPRSGEAGGLASGTEAYYSYDYGNVHFVSLDSHDSDRNPGSPMLTWLTNDLAATDQEWIVVFFHHPPYTKGSHNSDNNGDSGGRLKDMRENVLPILESYGVDLVLSGHSHSYERSYLLNGHYGKSNTLTGSMILDGGDGQELSDGAYQKSLTSNGSSDGTVYVVAGSAGKISGGPLNHPVMYASINALGSCMLQVDSNRLELKFLSSAGVIADSFMIEKDYFTGDPPTVQIDHPLDGATFISLQSINLDATASDPDGSVSSVEFFVNGLSVGTDIAAPWTLPYLVPGFGSFTVYAQATDDSANVVQSAEIDFFVASSQDSLLIPIVVGSDDAEEDRSGNVTLNNSVLALAEDAANGGQLVGLRFQNVDLPPASRIDSAYLIFTTLGTGDVSPAELQLYGERSFDAAPFTSGLGDLSRRRLTETRIPWNPAAWSAGGAAERSPDLSSLIQEIVNLPGWQNNQALALMIAGWGNRNALSFENANNGPQLKIHYTYLTPVGNTLPEVEIVSPAPHHFQTSLDSFDIAVEVRDSLFNVEQVEFWVNGSLVGTDLSYPFAQSFAPTGNGIYELVARATDSQSAVGSDTVWVEIDTAFVTALYQQQIPVPAYHAEEAEDGTMLQGDVSLDLVRTGDYSIGEQHVGLNFPNIHIPREAKIVAAYLQFTADAADQNYHPADLRITAHATDFSNGIAPTPFNFSARIRTEASVRWQPEIWTTVSESGPRQRTPDLRAIVQEIVDRPGWQAGNRMMLLLEGEGGRSAFSKSGSPTEAPVLLIEYEPASQIVRGPYLQMGTDTSMVIRYRS